MKPLFMGHESLLLNVLAATGFQQLVKVARLETPSFHHRADIHDLKLHFDTIGQSISWPNQDSGMHGEIFLIQKCRDYC